MLEGLTIVVTRPAEQAGGLIDKLKKLHADVVFFPTINVAAKKNDPKLNSTIEKLDNTDIIIFISRNAVKYAEKIINTRWPTLPEKLKIAAIGEGTADELNKFGLHIDLVPKNSFNSDSLLAMAEFGEVAEKNILIVRGEGGREQLANTLRERGATVKYAETYIRTQPEAEVKPMLMQHPDVIITTSGLGLQNLYDMTPNELRDDLLKTQLLVISESMMELAETLGFSSVPILANGASDQAIIRALC